MIPCFPDPYPDEIFYSLCARFSDRVQYARKVHIFRELFGSDQASPIVDLPCRLGYVIDNLSLGHSCTVDSLVDDHTLFPFYCAFLPEKERYELREQMVVGTGESIHRRVGIATSRVPTPPWLRYCPKCAEQNRASLGQCYWHRLHQIPGVEVCPVHATFLENSTVRIRYTSGVREFVSAERTIQTPFARSARDSSLYEFLMHIATEAAYLLEVLCPGYDARFFRERYHALLMRGGFIGSHSR